MIQCQNQWLVWNRKDIGGYNTVVLPCSHSFPIASAPIVVAVVFDSGHQGALFILSIHRVLIRRSNDKHARAVIDHLAEKVAV